MEDFHQNSKSGAGTDHRDNSRLLTGRRVLLSCSTWLKMEAALILIPIRVSCLEESALVRLKATQAGKDEAKGEGRCDDRRQTTTDRYLSVSQTEECKAFQINFVSWAFQKVGLW